MHRSQLRECTTIILENNGEYRCFKFPSIHTKDAGKCGQVIKRLLFFNYSEIKPQQSKIIQLPEELATGRQESK